MKNFLMLFTLAALSTSCGDNNKLPDARPADAPGPDAYCSNCPAAPALGVQIDRMGRPAVNTALNHTFDADATAAGFAKDAYNQNGSPGSWVSSSVVAFMQSLAIIDSLDTGLLCGGNGACAANPSPATGDGCGNQFGYNGNVLPVPSTPTATSYSGVAQLLAQDELFLDTRRGICDNEVHANYLAVEFAALQGMDNTDTSKPAQCGGREPHNDVMDTSLSALAAGALAFDLGLSGGTNTKKAAIGDGVGPHDDLLDNFPYLGPPHH
jgi:hypothetical protein